MMNKFRKTGKLKVLTAATVRFVPLAFCAEGWPPTSTFIWSFIFRSPLATVGRVLFFTWHSIIILSKDLSKISFEICSLPYWQRFDAQKQWAAVTKNFLFKIDPPQMLKNQQPEYLIMIKIILCTKNSSDVDAGSIPF